MTIPTEWLPIAAAILGSGGAGALLNALFSARGSVYKNLNDLVDQLQEDRQDDRSAVSALTDRVNTVIAELHVEREYSTALYMWGMAGAPPPPPQRRKPSP